MSGVARVRRRGEGGKESLRLRGRGDVVGEWDEGKEKVGVLLHGGCSL